MSLSIRERSKIRKDIQSDLAKLRADGVRIRERQKLRKQVAENLVKLQADAPQSAGGSDLDAVLKKAKSMGRGMIADTPAPDDWFNFEQTKARITVRLTDFLMSAIPESFAISNEEISARARSIVQSLELETKELKGQQSEKSAFLYGEYESWEKGTIERINKAISDSKDSKLIEKLRGKQRYIDINIRPLAVNGDKEDALKKMGFFEEGLNKLIEEGSSDPATLTDLDRLISGDGNNLIMTEFISRLQAAYQDDDNLDKAKQAAIGYITHNKAELEAA